MMQLSAWAVALFALVSIAPGCSEPFSVATDIEMEGNQATAPALPTGRTLRFVSLAIRDQPPTLEEARAFAAGKKSLDALIDEWLKSPEHIERVRRHFKDFFAITVGFTPFDQYLLVKNAEDVYRLPQKPDCTRAEAVEAAAWWLDNGEKILICPTSTSKAFRYPSMDPETVAACVGSDPRNVSDGCSVLCNAAANIENDPRCGCGPDQMLCMPCEKSDATSPACDPAQARNRELERDFNLEPIERGVLAYRESLSWFDYIGGDFFYGTRALYLSYLHGQGVLLTGDLSAAAASTALHKIPVDKWARAAWPMGAERAGVVTSTGYLNTYNTFRGRARALSERLLCRDVDASLNPEGYKTFINPQLTKADRVHGANPRCSYCHYGMDNHATMLFGYHPDGSAQYDYDPIPSQLGHLFGEDGEGPVDLVRGYIERGPGFDACMAKRVWTSFTGLSWEDALSEEARAQFTAAAHTGPGPLIRAVLKSPLLHIGAGP